jgi:twinkle protein
MCDQEFELTHVVDREPCPKCREEGNDRSGDNLARYNDGHGHCFACGYHEKGDGTATVSKTIKVEGEWKPYSGSYAELGSRQINAKTARLYGYKCAKVGDQEFQFWNAFNNDGLLVAQKLRKVGAKEFKWHGNSRNPQMFGQGLFKKGGRRLIITEGEIDCMTVSQLMENKWPVVSLPNGAASAVRDVKNNLDFVASYEEVVLLFDNDEAGREAAKAVADILPPGKAKIARTLLKDANEHMLAGETQALMNSIWEAQLYSPDEILHVSNVMSNVTNKEQEVWAFPWDQLTDYLIGQRSGEITLWTSGTGSGKSTIVRELMYHHLKEGRSVGAIMLEETPIETIDDLISLHISKPVRAIRAGEMMNDLRTKMGQSPIPVSIKETVDESEYNNAKQWLADTGFYVYNHEGHNAMANLIARMEFMATSLGVKVIVLDHITAAATAMMAEEDSNNERILIDSLMKSIRSLCVRTGVHVDVISQLRKSDKAYEEGSRITLQDLRGSGSLSSVPNTVVGLERDRQARSDDAANTTVVRVLKNRLTGRAGIASALFYDRDTARLDEVDVSFATEAPEFA